MQNIQNQGKKGGIKMSKYSSHYIDLTDCIPNVEKSIDGKNITIYDEEDIMRLNPSTIARAFIVLCQNHMPESVIDQSGIEIIKEFLEGGNGR